MTKLDVKLPNFLNTEYCLRTIDRFRILKSMKKTKKLSKVL